MRVVRLHAGPGGDRDFVARVEIVPFPDDKMPTVIVWGERVFVGAWALSESPGPQDDEATGEWIYVERFAFVSLTPSPGLPA